MKQTITLILLAISVQLFAQTDIKIKEEVVAIDGASRNSLTAMIPGAKADDVKKAWKKYLKDLKGKVKDKTIIFADNCEMKELGNNTFDVYSLVEDATDQGVRLVAAFDLGGAYLSSTAHPEKYPVLEKWVKAFAVEQAKEAVAQQIEANKKLLKDQEKALESMAKEKEHLESSIKDYEMKIQEARGAIEKNVAAQTSKKQEIENMKNVIAKLEAKRKAIK